MVIKKSYKSWFRQFTAQGGRGRMYQLFGKEMEEIINELNEVLAA